MHRSPEPVAIDCKTPKRLTGQELRDSIVHTAMSLVGVPWVHQGRQPFGPNAGLDCVGVPYVIADAHEMDPIDYYRYPPQGDGKTMIRELRKRLIEKSPLKREIADVVALHRPGDVVHHVGILVPHPNAEYGLVHASFLAKKIVFHSMTDKWWMKVTHCFEFPGV